MPYEGGLRRRYDASAKRVGQPAVNMLCIIDTTAVGTDGGRS
jgi:hypothetical protein